MCERKPSGKLNVPQNIHDDWAAGGEKRNALMKAFEECGMKKDPCPAIACCVHCALPHSGIKGVLGLQCACSCRYLTIASF